MRIYAEIARLAFRQQFAYRAASIAGIFTNSVFGVILSSVMLGFYASANDAAVRGWSDTEALTLVWINQALIMPVYLWGWWYVATSIRTGEIASDMLRPVSWYGLWLSRDAGRGAAAILMRFVPTMIVGWMLYDIALPANLATAASFLLVVVLAVWVSFSIRLLANLACFWLIDHRGIAAITISIGTLLSGMTMPLAFFPDPMREIAEVLPFQAVLMAPNNVYLGKEPVLAVVTVQVMWIAALALACLFVLRRGERKLVIHGG